MRRTGRPLAKDVLEKYMNLFDAMAGEYQVLPPDRAYVMDPATNQPQLDEQGKKIPIKPNADQEMFDKCADYVITCAKELAPYQTPTFRAVAIMAPGQMGQDKDNTPRLVGRIEHVIIDARPEDFADRDAKDISSIN
jgi:hypothetical protein